VKPEKKLTDAELVELLKKLDPIPWGETKR
jgi:hypothetical protein